MRPSFIPFTKDFLSSSDLKGGENFKKVLKSPISLSFKERWLIETPTVNFFPFDLFFLMTSTDFFEEIWFI